MSDRPTINRLAVLAAASMVLLHGYGRSSAAQPSVAAVVRDPSAARDRIVLRDAEGRPHSLAVAEDERLLVVAFLGVECPLARLSATRLNELADEYLPQGVRFLAIDSNQQDSLAEIRTFVVQHRLRFPMLKDRGTLVADHLAAVRTPQVVVLDSDDTVRYRGRVDDQYLVGIHRAEPTTHDLRKALDELLSGCPVSVPATEAAGCLITRAEASPRRSSVTYAEQIAGLLHRHCVVCHRPGQAAPMSLTEYDEVIGWAAMIDEVVRTDRMPPWHADRQHGSQQFANDLCLSETEKTLLRQWLADGCPLGDMSRLPRLAPYGEDGWSIGKPDAIVSIPQEFTVPATGTVEYQRFDVDPNFAEDRWVAAAEIRPGNRAVVHHCNVFLRPPGEADFVEQGSLGSICLAAMAVGTPAQVLPEGMAKRVPAGWRLVFVVHYTTIGTVQTDRTSLGLRFADPSQVKREVATRLMVDFDLCIPPQAADHRVEHTATLDQDMLLLAMFPHMHLRGKSFRYQATYPDGRSETLLNVPRWDFNWQNRYELATPKLLPAGTVLHCVAHYDNSTANAANPDPNITVRTGPRSEDEMFNGYYDLARADAEYPALQRPSSWLARVSLAILIAGVFMLRHRQRQNRRAA